MFACARRQYIRATLYFTVAASFRSNGILLALYVPWSMVVHPFLLSSALPSLGVVFTAGFHAILPFLPSLLHQRGAYRVFCVAEVANHALRSPWCNYLIPSIYTYVQRTYWNVSFLSYWTLSQLPNIVLALPLLAPLLFYSIPHTLSLIQGKSLGSLRPPTTAAHSVHAAFLCMTLLTSAHTQIALRLLPALPCTYWATAALLIERPRWGRAYVVWAVLWGATSIVLWAAFLPPA
jgi:phosphatidylinositol glycan class V